MDEPSDAAPAAPPAVPPPGSARRSHPWLREAILILVSVALGFGASEFSQYRQERGLAASVLRAVRDEVVQNEATLRPLQAKHEAWQKALAKIDPAPSDKAGYQFLTEARPDADSPIGVPLKSAAWQMAVSTGALRLLDFDVAQALSEIYTAQMTMTEHHNQFVATALYVPATFDPAARVVATKVLWGVISEVAGNERYLLDIYRKQLPVLQRAAAD